eukprot:1159730-Pelagomonas_calceolata.AAC.8
MSWTLFVFLLSSILQTGLLGRTMYGVRSRGRDPCVPVTRLLSIADLEQDFINPYDLSKKLNSFVVSADFFTHPLLCKPVNDMDAVAQRWAAPTLRVLCRWWSTELSYL